MEAARVAQRLLGIWPRAAVRLDLRRSYLQPRQRDAHAGDDPFDRRL